MLIMLTFLFLVTHMTDLLMGKAFYNVAIKPFL